jgi:flagellar hook assembly protein FlgD
VNCDVQLKVNNLLGQEVITLVNKNQSAGNYTTTWNGLNSTGQQIASDVYNYKLVTETGFVQTKKLFLLR